MAQARRLSPLERDFASGYVHLADEVAQRYIRRYGRFADEIQESAYEGLHIAVTRFDSSRGAPFECFARPRIVGEIKNRIRCELANARRHLTGTRAHVIVVDLREAQSTARADVGQAVDDEDAFEALLGSFPQRHQRILRHFFGSGLSREEFATRLGISRASLSRILNPAIRSYGGNGRVPFCQAHRERVPGQPAAPVPAAG